MRYRYLGKEKLLSLGQYPTIEIKEAREKTLEAQKLLAAGMDPQVQKQLDKIEQEHSARTSFLPVAEEYLESLLDRELATNP